MTGSVEPKKILLCDDDEIYVDILEKLLSDNGFSVVTANSVFDCLEKLMETKPDLLLLDIDMPDGNGLQLMETLAKQPALFRAAIMVISGYQDAARIERARALGASKFFIKPISPRQLLEEVKKVLGADQVSHGQA